MPIISGYRPGVSDTSYLDHIRTQPGETAPPVDFGNLPGDMGDMNTEQGAMAGLSKLAASPSSYSYMFGPPHFTGHGTGRVLDTIGADYGVTLPDNFNLADYTAGRAGEHGGVAQTVGGYSSLARQIADARTPWTPPGVDPPATVHMFGPPPWEGEGAIYAPALSNYLGGNDPDARGRPTLDAAYAQSAERRNAYLGGLSDRISEDQQHLADYADEQGVNIDHGVTMFTPGELIGPEGVTEIAEMGDDLNESGLPVDPRTGEPGVAYDPETGQPIEYDDGETPPGTPAGGTPYGFDESPEHTWISGHDTGIWDSAFEKLRMIMPEGYYPDPPAEPRGQSPLAEVISGRGALPRNASTGGMGISMPEPTVPIGWSPGGVATSSGGARKRYGETPYGQGGDFGLPV